MSQTTDGKEILSIPARLVLDALHGKRNIYTEYRTSKGETFYEEDWEIENVNLKQSKIEGGEDNFVEFTLIRRKDRVFRDSS